MKISMAALLIPLSTTTVQAFSTVPTGLIARARPLPATNEASMIRSSRRWSKTEENSGVFSEEVQQEAREVLEKVGWARPMEGEGEMTSEDPFVQQINAGIQRDFGVDLDDLLNPAKVGKWDGAMIGFHCNERKSHRQV